MKNYLEKLKINPDVIRKVESGIEVKFTDSWEKVGRLLNWFYKKGVIIEWFQAEIIPQKGIFKVRFIIK